MSLKNFEIAMNIAQTFRAPEKMICMFKRIYEIKKIRLVIRLVKSLKFSSMMKVIQYKSQKSDVITTQRSFYILLFLFSEGEMSVLQG